MELIKQTEQYKLVDSLEEKGWKVSGTVYNNVNGSLSVSCSVSSELDYVGNLSYSKPAEGNVSINYDVAETNRDAFAAYADTLIDGILEHFKA